MNAVCPECGAAIDDAAKSTCRDCFDALLAYENERPDAFGPVHHLTVACYFLQHPSGYGQEILRSWHELLDGAMSGAATVHHLQKRMGQRFAGSTKVRDSAAVRPANWPRHWPV